MPKGVYIRTKPHSEKQRQVARENCRKLGKQPKTQKQREALRKNLKKSVIVKRMDGNTMAIR